MGFRGEGWFANRPYEILDCVGISCDETAILPHICVILFNMNEGYYLGGIMATDQEITQYMNAQDELEVLGKKIDRVIKPILLFAEIVNHPQYGWKTLSVANLKQSIPMPPEVVNTGAGIDAQTWPDIGEIAQLLSDWHDKEFEVINAWRRIPESKRARLQPPF